jgi:hypothetical protein
MRVCGRCGTEKEWPSYGLWAQSPIGGPMNGGRKVWAVYVGNSAIPKAKYPYTLNGCHNCALGRAKRALGGSPGEVRIEAET